MEQNTSTPQTSQQRPNNNVSNNGLSVKELFFLCLANWKWFLLCLVVCVAGAKFYLLKTPKTYTRSMSVLIKDDKNGHSIGTDAARVFSDMGIAASSSNVYNELLTIKSNDVAVNVVKRMNLNVHYTIEGTFRPATLYGTNLPIKVEFPGVNDNDYISFDLTVKSAEKFSLSNLVFNDEESAKSVSGKFGYNITKTPFGRLVIIKNDNFSKEFVGKTIHVTYLPIEIAKNNLMANFSAGLSDKNATVIDMTYSDLSTQRAEDVLNTIIAVYNENWVKDKNQIAVSTSQFIGDRLDVIEKELGSVDSNISSYKSANGITDLQQTSQIYLQQTTAADAQMLDLNNQIYMAKYIRSYLSGKGSQNQLLPANTGLKDASITTQIQQYNTTLLQRNNLVANSSENNPIVQDLDNQLTAIRSSLAHSIDNALVTLEKQLSSQQSFAGQASSKIASNPTQAKHLLTAERQQKVKESLYLFLLQKREENELSQAFTAYNTRIVSAPHGSIRPTAPVTRNIYLIALVLGFGIPFGILYLRESLNSKVRGKSDLDKKVSAPYLGEIPVYADNIKPKPWEFWKKKHEHKNIIVKAGSRGMLNEAFRIVATNLDFMTGKSNGANVCMVTSYNQGSGKSFTTINLAATLTLKNNRVLVIDGDLRHASSSAVVNRPAKGISNYLSGNADDIKSLIVPLEKFNGLHILPVGTIPPNPSELLGSKRFGELIQELRSQYDYILIDCPPADMMADATIVGRHVDYTLFVIRAGLFERNMLPQLEEAYTTGKLKNVSLILNATTTIGGRYGYRYGYHYGYRYGYHYGYGDQNSKE